MSRWTSDHKDVVRGSPDPAHADRNLLVGMLAFQNGFVRREQLLSAMNAWLLEKDSPLEDILLRQGALDADQRQLLVALVRQHLAMHDNVAEQSLSAISSVGSVREELRSLADPDLNASLLHVATDGARATGSASTDVRGSPNPAHSDRARFETLPLTVGAPTSQGGRFRILRPHARGGLGEVHVALDTELNREVALKEIQSRHADHPQSRARFTLEAEITGGLEHPGIVPVYGLGTFADGRPYYAMRFIRGDSLAERINHFHRNDWTAREGQRSLERRKLLARFIDVCEAIQYAHDRGVLHRDLKPGNIMLGKYGETLVVDWGLAKPLGSARAQLSSSDVDAATLPDEPPLVPTSGSRSAPTEMGAVVGTPAYMSPEQAGGRGDEVAAASDVYGLGATLYALLTGRPPFDPREAEAHIALLKRVAAGDFRPPRKVSPLIPKPLEAICLKAMALKPADRYVTPGQIRDDVEHWLADEPVSAAAETAIERSSRFLRKHKSWALATAATLLLVALVSTAAAVLINEQRNKNAQLAADNLQLAENQIAARKDAQAHARRADEQSALALKTLNTVVYSIQGELTEIPAARPVRQKLLAHALKGLEAVAGAAGTARQASRSQLVTHWELGEMFTLLGSPQATDEFRNAHKIALGLAGVDPTSAQAQRDLAISHERLGDQNRVLGNINEAKRHFEQDLMISRRLAEGDPANTQAQRDLSVSHNKLGDLNRALGDIEEAKTHFEQGLAISRRLADDDPSNADAQRDLAICYNNLGDLSLSLGDVPQANRNFEQGLKIGRRLADDDPNNAELQRDVWVSYIKLGDVLRTLGDDSGANKRFEQGLEISRRLAEADPENAQAQRDLWMSYNKLGDVSRVLENVDKAKDHFEKGLEISRRLAEADTTNAQSQRDLSISYNKLGDVSRASQNDLEATRHFEKGLEISRGLAEADPANAQAQRDLSVSYIKLGDVNRALGNIPAAKKHFEQCLQISRRLADADPSNAQAQVDLAYSYTGLAKCEMAAKNHAAANERFAESIALLEKLEAAGQLQHRPLWLSLLSENRNLLADCERQLAAAQE
jgi:serine/threonine protein kinase/tetratricopeptide (TPR) repeat protein